MAHQCIKYRLTEQGTIPDFIYLGEDGVNGVYGVVDPNTSSPRNLIQVGITNNDATGDFEVISTKDELLTYLSTIGANWKQFDSANICSTTATPTIPFDYSAATDSVWGRLDALNAT
jgi:hypothetical protein